MSKLKEVLTVEDLAKYLNIHPVTVYNYLKKNELPAFRIGKKLAV